MSFLRQVLQSKMVSLRNYTIVNVLSNVSKVQAADVFPHLIKPLSKQASAAVA
jgi:hypothetical protein